MRGVATLLTFVGSLALAVSTEIPAALAADPPRLQTHVTDQTGSLDDVPRIEAALAAVNRDQGVDPWVLFVRTTGTDTPEAFARNVAAASSLGVDDALILVALDDRSDYVWLSDGLEEITDDELDAAVGDVLEPRLASGDFDGAAIATAQALGQAAVATVEPTTPGSPGGSATSPDLGWLLPVALIGGGGWLVASRVRGLRNERRTAEERDRRVGELARRANGLLVAADEAVRDAEAEIAFAEAQFGPEEASALQDSVTHARAEVRAAFAIRQQLDDGVPEDVATRERLLGEVVTHAEKSDALLDAAAQRVAELRSVERDLPTIIPTVVAAIDATNGRLPDVEATLTRLEPVAGGSLGAVRGNAVEAGKRLTDAHAEMDRIDADVKAGRTAAAARRVRAVQRAVAEAGGLLDAIGELADTIRDVLPKVDPAIAEAERSIAVAASAGGPAVDAAAGDAATGLDKARAALDEARAARAATPPDPVSAYRQAVLADQLADAATADLRATAERLVRQRGIAEQAIRAADARFIQASQFVAARHLGVGHAARTRLTESERWLAEARGTFGSDDARSAEAARHAADLAESAYQLAAADFDRFDQYGRPSTGSDVLQAALPYVLPILLGGRGGWGGTRWGQSGGGGGIFGGGGVFGGGGGLGGGGVFGGGGAGRGRGGRW